MNLTVSPAPEMHFSVTQGAAVVNLSVQTQVAQVNFAVGAAQQAQPLPAARKIHNQTVPALTWIVVHGLGFRPNVYITDLSGQRIFPDENHVNTSELHITFGNPQTGQAHLN